MSTPARLPATEVQAALGSLAGWRLEDGHLRRDFEFADFVAAFGFMARAALVAERLGHHPDWRNVYNKLTVRLATHDVGGITAHDLELARAMNALFD
jgi:4a-hydroxytetrahydrobiopterin dehydratase